jgi:hypothetical protein
MTAISEGIDASVRSAVFATYAVFICFRNHTRQLGVTHSPSYVRSKVSALWASTWVLFSYVDSLATST